MKKVLMKGNHAVVEGALCAGCRYFFGYPITPQSEILEKMAERLPETGGVFLQAESEVSAINMVIGASAAGGRVMTASSGPGMDLMQEGLGNLAAHELPCVMVNIMRGGPGNGALHPSQQDYDQAIRGGRGDQRSLVLAPWSGQEMYDLTKLSFELADKYRNTVVLLADGVLAQVFETVELKETDPVQPEANEWILDGANGRSRKLSIAHFPVYEVYNDLHRRMQLKYQQMVDVEQRSESQHVSDDCELVFVAYGIMARNCLAAVNELRNQGIKVGLFRPISLFPFPTGELSKIAQTGVKLLAVEMSSGQMARDVELCCPHNQLTVKPGQATAQVPGKSEIIAWAKSLLGRN